MVSYLKIDYRLSQRQSYLLSPFFSECFAVGADVQGDAFFDVFNLDGYFSVNCPARRPTGAAIDASLDRDFNLRLFDSDFHSDLSTVVSKIELAAEIGLREVGLLYLSRHGQNRGSVS